MAWGDVSDGVVASAAASVTAAFGQATTAGDFLVAYVVANGATGVITCSDGTWTKVGEANSGAGAARSAVFLKPNCGAGEAAPTFSATGAANMHALLREFSGGPADTSGVLFKASTGTGANVTAQTVNSNTGNLFLSCDFNRATSGAVITSADAYNNGATPNGNENNDASNTFHHYRFAWGVSTNQAVSDGDTTSGWAAGNTAVLFVTVPPGPAPATDSGTVTATGGPAGAETIGAAATVAATSAPAATEAVIDQAAVAATSTPTAAERIAAAATLAAAMTPAATEAITDQAAASTIAAGQAAESIMEAATFAASATPTANELILDSGGTSPAVAIAQAAVEAIIDAALAQAAMTPAATEAIVDQAAALLASAFLLVGETIAETATDQAAISPAGIETIKTFGSGTAVVIVTPSGYIFVRGRAVALAVATIAKAAGIVTAVRATAPVTGL